MKYILLLAFSIALINGYSQNSHPQIPFEHVPIPGTINSSQVNDLLQDHHGLIWAAGDGLFKYDGYKFTSYRHLETGESIGGQEIKSLFNDKHSNKLLIGTHSYGVVEYDYATNKINVLPSEGGVPIISHITQTNDGTVWASSFSNGLYYLENDTLKKVDDPKKRFRNVTSLLAFGNNLLADKSKTIYILRNKQVVDSINVAIPGFDFPTATTRVTTMTIDHEGHIWMGTERSGVLVYDTVRRTFIKHFSPEMAPFYNRINRILIDKNNTVWILAKANGVVVYSPGSDNFIHITKNPLIERSLSGNNCTSILQDNTGIIWIGSTGDLNKYDPSKIKFRHIYNNPFSPISLSDNMVRGLYEDRQGKLWIGTDGGIIHILDRQKMQMEKVEVKLKSTNQHIVPVYFNELNANIMLIGSSIGLLEYNRTKKTFGYFKPTEKLTKNKQVRQVLIDGDNLYFLHSGMLVVHNLKTGLSKVFNQYGPTPAVRNGTAIYLDTQKRLWIGVTSGLSLYNPVNDSFQHFPFEMNTSRPLGTYFMILSIEEYQHKLWVGTFNSGLWSMDLNLKKPVIVNRTERDNLPNNTVYATIPDSDGNLWISTNQGISKYEIDKNHFVNFSTADGLQHEEFNRLAYFKCASGDIVFGGINGLNIFNPKLITIQEENYAPQLLGVSVYSEDSNESTFRGLMQQSSLTLDYDQNDVDFHFFVPNYRYPRRFEMYYKLSGYDPDWVKAETNTIHYSNLKSGEYPLEIKSVSNAGIEKVSTFSLIIKHPFWQTWWFIIISVGTAIFLVFTIIQSNIRKTKHDKIRLETLLSQRTQEIEKSREELANLNQKKDLIFSILSHDLRSPLTTLKGFLSILIDDSDNLSKEDVRKHASSIRNSVTSSLDLIDNTLFWSLSQTGNITYTPTDFSLGEMLQKIGALYQLTAEKKRIQFSVEVQDKVTVHGDENMIYVTLRNLVSNALKFTPEGKSVKIVAGKNHTTAEITVQDEGIGMSPSYVEKLIAEDQLQLKKGTSNEKGTGLGLILCKKFIDINHGKMRVTSIEGKGTEFVVNLPLSPKT